MTVNTRNTPRSATLNPLLHLLLPVLRLTSVYVCPGLRALGDVGVSFPPGILVDISVRIPLGSLAAVIGVEYLETWQSCVRAHTVTEIAAGRKTKTRNHKGQREQGGGE